MIPTSFCPDHHGIHLDPDLELPARARRACSAVFSVVSRFADQAFPSRAGSAALKWLQNFREWGDGYQRLVVTSMIDGPLGSIVSKSLNNPATQPPVISFLVALITNQKLKLWVAELLCYLVPQFADSLIAGGSLHRKYIPLFALGGSVFNRVSVASRIAGCQETMRRLFLASSVCWMLPRSGRMARTISLLVSIPHMIMQIPALARQVIYSNQQARDTNVSLFSACPSVAIRRVAEGEKFEHDADEMVCAFMMSFQLKRFKSGFHNGIKVPEFVTEPPDDDVMSLLMELNETLAIWNEDAGFFGFNPLRDQFAIHSEMPQFFFAWLPRHSSSSECRRSSFLRSCRSNR
jgi:hypothetical protein